MFRPPAGRTSKRCCSFLSWTLVVLSVVVGTSALVSFRIRAMALDSGIFERAVAEIVDDPGTTELLRTTLREVLDQGVDEGFDLYGAQLADLGVSRRDVDAEVELLAERTSQSPVLLEEFARAIRQSHRYATGLSPNPATVNSDVFAAVLETETRRLAPVLGSFIDFEGAKLHITLPRPRDVSGNLEVLADIARIGPAAAGVLFLGGLGLHSNKLSVVRFLGRWNLTLAFTLAVISFSMGYVWTQLNLGLPVAIPSDAITVYRTYMWGPTLAVATVGLSCSMLAYAFTETD